MRAPTALDATGSDEISLEKLDNVAASGGFRGKSNCERYQYFVCQYYICT